MLCVHVDMCACADTCVRVNAYSAGACAPAYLHSDVCHQQISAEHEKQWARFETTEPREARDAVKWTYSGGGKRPDDLEREVLKRKINTNEVRESLKMELWTTRHLRGIQAGV